MSRSVEQWSTGQVQNWLTKHGYGGYSHQFEAEGVSGDVLIHLSHETLRDLNVTSVGHRLGILKAIYKLKVEQNIPIEADGFIPQDIDTWTEDRTGRSNLASQAAKVQNVMDEVAHISHELKMLRDQLLPVLRQIAGKTDSNDGLMSPPTTTPVRKDTLSPVFPLVTPPSATNSISIPATDTNKRNKPAALTLISPASIKNGSRSPLPFLQKKEKGQRSPTNDKHPAANTTPVSPFIKSEAHLIREVEPPKSPAAAELNIGAIRVYGDRLPGRESEAYKALRITLESTSQQILDMALRKYDLTDDGKNYTLVIVHGNRERYFGLDDYPLKYYQQLQQAKESPMFVMRPNKQMKRSNTMKATMPVVPSRHASLMRRADARTTTIGNTTTPPLRRDSRRPDDQMSPLNGNTNGNTNINNNNNNNVNNNNGNGNGNNKTNNANTNNGTTASTTTTITPTNSGGRHGPYSHAHVQSMHHQQQHQQQRHQHHHQTTGSGSSANSANAGVLLSSNVNAIMSTSTPSTSSLQLTMNERFDEIMERWHHERNV
ncbi:hypothetical protein BDF19DRAFT_443400 [Syncephalis fuscata]|nr:hypothetical protein BDF19DRAFT_443400 [Syncephalis fuscata]